MFEHSLTNSLQWPQYRSAAEINSAMGRVYGNMSMAILTSMIVSYLVSTSPALMQFLFTGIMKWLVLLAPLAAIFVIGMLMQSVTRSTAQLLLHGFAALMGLSFATIFVIFNMGSIITAFMGASVLFAVMSFYGYFTKRDLTSVGQFMFVGLIAIVIASLINIVMASFWPGVIDNALVSSVISAIAIVIFLGLTAYDTQKIREEVSQDNDGVAEIRGALILYMDFINLFLSLLNLFGERK